MLTSLVGEMLQQPERVHWRGSREAGALIVVTTGGMMQVGGDETEAAEFVGGAEAENAVCEVA